VRTSNQQSRVIRLLVIMSPSPFHHIPTLIFRGRARLRAAVQTAR
jgi:hypothetical protein